MPGGVDESGTERVIPSVLWQIERLARRHELFVYVLRYHAQPRSYPLLGATVRDLGRPAGFIRQHTAARRALNADGPFDVVHGLWALPAGVVATSVAKRLGVPSVVTCDSGEFVALADIGYGAQLHWRQRIAVRAATRLATVVTVCSAYQAELARRCGVTAEVIPLGVDTSVFRPPAPRQPGPPWRLLHVASLNPVKDQRTLLEAVRLVRAQGVDVHLDIVGEDTLDGAIERTAREKALDTHISFHGPLRSGDLVPLYQRSHLFVLSSRHEAAGVVLLEAAACGLPIAGTAVGYLADWHPQRAVAVPPRDPAALAAAIVSLIRDPDRRAQLSRSAGEWTLAHDADWTADRLERLYERIRAVQRPPDRHLAEGDRERRA